MKDAYQNVTCVRLCKWVCVCVCVCVCKHTQFSHFEKKLEVNVATDSAIRILFETRSYTGLGFASSL
jgi:hypothetical protein